MKINFNLRDSKAKSKTSIVLVVRHNQKTLKWATGLHVSPNQWDVKRQRPNAGALPNVREQLNQIEVIAEKALSSAGYLQQSDFSKLMNEASGKTEPAKTPYLLAYIRQYCEENTRKGLKTAGHVLYDFITGSSACSWDKIDWSKAKAKDVRFERIDWDFRSKLIRYCFAQNFSVNYTQAIVKRFGQFVNQSRKDAHHSNSISKEHGWGIIQTAGVEKAKNLPVALTLDELTRLASLPLSGMDEKIRDCFLIGCLSGQRWSDYGFINQFQVRDGLLTIHQQEKTESFAEVELDLFEGLLPYSLGDLLAKYGNQSPIITEGAKGINYTADVAINKRIKELCKTAGITEKIRWSDDKGGKSKQYTMHKYEQMGTHTGRRTFATVWYNLGMPCEEICSVTGHATTTQLMEYIGATPMDKRTKRRATVAKIKAELKQAKLKAI